MSDARKILCLPFALLLAAVLLHVTYAALSPVDEELEALEARLWLPGVDMLQGLHESASSRQSGDIFALEGEEGFENTIIFPEMGPGAAAAGDSRGTQQEKERYTAAVALMREGRLEEAERELLNFLAVESDHAEGWRRLGDCRYNLGKVSEALGAYRIALRKEKDNYLAERGQGVAALYLGYDSWEKGNSKQAHTYFQTAMNSLYACLQVRPEDELARYGQALSAEGVSRQLYVIAVAALDTENREQAKEVIRNCLDILDAAIQATETRMEQRPQDSEARMLLGTLLVRRARILQPFGHVDEAQTNIQQAIRAFDAVVKLSGKRSSLAKGQIEICQALLQKWRN